MAWKTPASRVERVVRERNNEETPISGNTSSSLASRPAPSPPDQGMPPSVPSSSGPSTGSGSASSISLPSVSDGAVALQNLGWAKASVIEPIMLDMRLINERLSSCGTPTDYVIGQAILGMKACDPTLGLCVREEYVLSCKL